MPLRLGTHQESPQPAVSGILVQTVQVENIVDGNLARGNLAQGAPVEFRGRRGLRNSRRRGRSRGTRSGSGRRMAPLWLLGLRWGKGRSRGCLPAVCGDARLGLHLIDGMRQLTPKLGFVLGNLAAALAGPAAAAMVHSCAFCGAGTAAVAGGGVLGTSTKKRPVYLVPPASLPASSPEPK